MADVRIRFKADAVDFIGEINKANAALATLGKQGATLATALKSKDLAAVDAVMTRNMNTTLRSGDAMKAYTDYAKDMLKVQQRIVRESSTNKDGVSMWGDIPTGDALAQVDRMRDSYESLFTVMDGKGRKKWDVNKFMGDVGKQGEAYKTFGTELESVNRQMSLIEETGRKLVLGGGKPEDIKKLSEEYSRLSTEHDRLSGSANGTGTRIKNLIKNFVSAQLIVFAIRKTFQLFTQGIKESSQAAAEAEQVHQRFLTVFDGLSKATEAVDDLVNSYGLANTSAKNIMATIGDMAAGLGASESEAAQFADTTAKFIQDLIAFKDVGGDVIEITQAFMSGAVGNTRNFRQWGSIVKEATVEQNLYEKGMADLTGEALEWAKAQERVNMVMSQQKNAMGATEREWDMMLSVSRRYDEQMKVMKENIGVNVNKFFLPMKTWILDLATAWNTAETARNAYLSGEQDFKPSPENDKAIKRDFTALSIVGIDIGKKNMSAGTFQAVVDYYGAPFEYVLQVIEGFATLADGELEKVEKHYSEPDRRSNLSKMWSQNKLDMDAYYNYSAEKIDAINILFKRLGASEYVKQKSTAFLPNLSVENIVGSDTTDAANKAKMDELFKAAQALTNTILTESDSAIVEVAKYGLEKVKGEMNALNNEMQGSGFTKQNDALNVQLKSLEYRNALQAKYANEGEDVISVLMEFYDAQLKIFDIEKDAVKNGMDKTEAENQRIASLAIVNSYYGLQLKTTRELTTQARLQEQSALMVEETTRRTNALLDARKDNNALFSSNAAAGRNLGRSWNESAQQSASYSRSEARISNASQVADKTNSFLTDGQLLAIRESMGALSAEMFMSAKEIEAVSAYRTQLETQAELEYQQSLKDARDSSLQQIESMWDSLGDVGMVQGWIDTFNNIKNFEIAKGTSKEDAFDLAKYDTIWAIILEFASHLETVSELFGMVTTIFKELGPIVDDFLAPLLVVLEPIIEMLNVFVPILTLLFPIIQALAVALNFVVTVIGVFVKAVEWAIAKITFWTTADDIPWSDVADAWQNGFERTERIWAMEIDARAEYVSALTETQKGELKAYDEMYKNGLLTFGEYENMVQSNIYGKTAGGTSYGDTINPSTSIGTNINMGAVTIIVNAGNVTDPAEVARLTAAELAKIDRRGGSYAVA